MPMWYAYKLVDHEPEEELSYTKIFKGLDKLGKKFNVTYEPVHNPTLLVWDLELEEKKTPKRHTRSATSEAPEKTSAPAIKKFTFALSVENEVLFVNRVLTKVMKDPLTKALACQSFEQLPLTHGTPSNLLMLYTQSKGQNKYALDLQYQEEMFNSVEKLEMGIPLVEEIEMPSDEHKDLHLQIGSLTEKIPQIRKLAVDVRNVPVTTKNPNLQGYRVDEIAVEVSAPSVFHLYKNLAEEGIIKNIPPWLKKMRASGSYHCNAHFT